MKVRIQDVIGIAAVAGLYALMGACGITCPIKYLTGISCAGCGMTRAWITLLHGDLAGALRYHPLVLLPVVAAVLWLLRDRLSERFLRWAVYVICALFIAVYLVRLFLIPGDIVVFEPEHGLWLGGLLGLLGYK